MTALFVIIALFVLVLVEAIGNYSKRQCGCGLCQERRHIEHESLREGEYLNKYP